MENDIHTPAGEQTPLSTVSTQKPIYKRPFFYALVVIVLVAAGTAVYFLKPNPAQKHQETVEYTTDLPLDHISVQVPYDQDIERYPITPYTAAFANVDLNVYEGLVVYRGTNLEPGLAESWTNPDPLTWRFKLRKGVKFHSGDIFTAKDVKYTIEQAKASANSKVQWTSQQMAARIDSVKIIDDYTVELKTKEPDATLLPWLVWMGIVSQDQIKRDGLDKAIGTGPYEFVSLSKREASLEANKDYWGGVPKVKKIVYKMVADPAKAKTALEKGQLDIITVNSGNTSDLKAKGFQSANFRTGGISYFFLDATSAKSKYITGTDKNPFKDLRVRKAIALTLDVPKLISDAGLNAEPLTQFATQELIGFNPELKRHVSNVTEAKRLMTEAGFSNGFTVTMLSDQQAEHLRAVNEIKKQLAAIGITIVPTQPETDKFYEQMYAGDFAMLYIGYYPDTIDSLDLIDTLFHAKAGSDGVFNVTNYSNQEINAVIDQARSTFDEEKRVKLTREAHTLVMDNLPSIPLFTETYQIYSRDTVMYKPSVTAILLGFDMSGRQKTEKYTRKHLHTAFYSKKLTLRTAYCYYEISNILLRLVYVQTCHSQYSN